MCEGKKTGPGAKRAGCVLEHSEGLGWCSLALSMGGMGPFGDAGTLEDMAVPHLLVGDLYQEVVLRNFKG